MATARRLRFVHAQLAWMLATALVLALLESLTYELFFVVSLIGFLVVVELTASFMVVATQNPIELEGTFELPEAQRDRFQMKLTAGLPTRDEESDLFDRFDADPTIDAEAVGPVVEDLSIQDARETVASVFVDPKVKDYILNLVEATRESPDVEYGASPRASIAFLNTSKALAAIRGREYVIPDDVKALAAPILVHRLVLSTDAELSDYSPEALVDDILDSVPVPTGDTQADASRAVGDGGASDFDSSE